MRIRRTLGATLAGMAALLVAFASPALAQGGTGGGGTGGGGGGGGGGTTTAPAVSCAHIVSAIVDPNPAPINPHPVYPEPIVVQSSTPPATGTAVAFDVTVNNQCIDEGGGPRSSLSVGVSTYDTATGALLNTGVNMQPPGAIMTWRSWSSVPTTIDPTWANFTKVISLTKANGQVQDSLTYTVAQIQQDIMTAAATGLPVALR